MKLSLKELSKNQALIGGLALGLTAYLTFRAAKAVLPKWRARKLRLDNGADVEATTRAVRAVGIATWT